MDKLIVSFENIIKIFNYYSSSDSLASIIERLVLILIVSFFIIISFLPVSLLISLFIFLLFILVVLCII